MIEISFNGRDETDIDSLELFAVAMARYDRHAEFELWLSVPGGPRMCMLRNREHAFLMYLRFPGDSGFVSSGSAAAEGKVPYTLSNGQVDEYPESWCLPARRCYWALASFFTNDGQRPERIAWQEPPNAAGGSGA